MPGSKMKSLRIHAKQRAQERYKVTMSRDDLKEVARLIRQNSGKFIAKQSNRVTIWEIIFKNKTLRTVYDKKRGQVITFLPTTD